MHQFSDLERRAAHEVGHCVLAWHYNIDIARVSIQSGEGINAAMFCDMSHASIQERLRVLLGGWAGKAYFNSHRRQSEFFNIEAYKKQLPASKRGVGSLFGIMHGSKSDMALAMRISPVVALFPRAILIEIGGTIHRLRNEFYSLIDLLLVEYSLDGDAIAKSFKGQPLEDADKSRSRLSDIEHWLDPESWR